MGLNRPPKGQLRNNIWAVPQYTSYTFFSNDPMRSSSPDSLTDGVGVGRRRHLFYGKSPGQKTRLQPTSGSHFFPTSDAAFLSLSSPLLSEVRTRNVCPAVHHGDTWLSTGTPSTHFVASSFGAPLPYAETWEEGCGEPTSQGSQSGKTARDMYWPCLLSPA